MDPVEPASPKDPAKDPKRKPPAPGPSNVAPMWRGLLGTIPSCC